MGVYSWGDGEGSPHARILVSLPIRTPSFPFHLFPYVPGCSSLDVFTPACCVHTSDPTRSRECAVHIFTCKLSST